MVVRHSGGRRPRRVVVAGFTNETGHPALDAFGDQIETWISDSLSHLGRIKVITAAVDLGRLAGRSIGPCLEDRLDHYVWIARSVAGPW